MATDRDIGTPRLAILALVGGLLGGIGFFAISSSRGLDAYELGAFVNAVALVVFFVSVIVGIGRWTLTDEKDLIVAAPLFLVGAIAGQALAPRVIPGNTTDGTYVSNVFAEGQLSGAPEVGGAVCTWRDGRVVEVRSRRTFRAEPVPPPGRFRISLPSGDTTIERVVLQTGMVESTRTLPGAASATEPSGFTGRLTFDGYTLDWSCPPL